MFKPKFVIFDMDGLMFDTETVGEQCMAQAFNNHGLKLTHENYLRVVGCSGEVARRTLFDLYGKDYPFESIRKDTRELLQKNIQENGLIIKPGLMELLNYLKNENIPCCVASSTRREGVENYLEIADVKDYFQFLVCGNEVSMTKPEPEIFLKALEKTGVKANEALVLEDSINGIIASSRANIPVICVPDMIVPPKEIRAKCLCIIDRLDLLVDLIK